MLYITSSMCILRLAHSQCADGGRRTGGATKSLSSVKGRPDFALGLRCINRVICTSPPSTLAFFSSFFLIFRHFTLGRTQVGGHFISLLSDPLGFTHQKKVPRVSPKPPCSSSSLKLPQPLVRIIRASIPQFHPYHLSFASIQLHPALRPLHPRC